MRDRFKFIKKKKKLVNCVIFLVSATQYYSNANLITIASNLMRKIEAQ